MKPFFDQLNASLSATAKVKTVWELRAQMLALKADCDAFCKANPNPLSDSYSDAVAGLSDALSDCNVRFESEAPTSSTPGEHYRPGGHGSV